MRMFFFFRTFFFFGPLGCFNNWAEIRKVHRSIFLFFFIFLGGFNSRTVFFDPLITVCEVDEVEVEVEMEVEVE